PDPRDPQGIGLILRRVLSDLGWNAGMNSGRVLAEWDEIVGERLATHCRPVSFEDGVLVVSASSFAWAAQVGRLDPQPVAADDALADPSALDHQRSACGSAWGLRAEGHRPRRCPAQLDEGPPHRHLARPPRHLWLTPVSPWGLVLGSWVLGAGCAYPGPLGPGPWVVGPGSWALDTWFPWLWARLFPDHLDLWRPGGSTVALSGFSALRTPITQRSKPGAGQGAHRPR